MARTTNGEAVLLTMLVALGIFSVTLYVPSMPAITADFGVAPTAVQSTLGLFLLGFAGAQLLVGPFSDRFGRRPVLLVGLILFLLISVLCALAPTIQWLQGGRILQGAIACVGPVVARAMVRDRYHGLEAVRIFAFIGTALALAPALAPIIGGFIQELAGWRANFGVLALFGLVLFGLTARRLEESHRPTAAHGLHPRRLAATYFRIVRNRYFLGNVMAGSLIFGGLFSYNTLAPYLFIERLGVSPPRYGFLMLFTVSAYAIGSFLAGRLRRRMRGHWLIVLGTTSAALGGFVMLMLSGELSLMRVIAPMMAFQLGMGLVLPPSIAQAMHPFPGTAGSASAMMGFIQMASGALATFVAQWLFDGTAVSLGWITFALGSGALLSYLALTAGTSGAEDDAGGGH